MESDDQTVGIARRHGARVEVVPRNGHSICEAYRDYAVKNAAYDWVLVVDADEIVTPQLRDYLYAELERDNTPRAYLVARKNHFLGRWMRSQYPDRQLRFFNKIGSNWPDKIHSRPSHAGPEVKIPARRHELALIHLAEENASQRLSKIDRYTDSEVKRRAGSYKGYKLYFRPFYAFMRSFLIRGGWRDGRRGFKQAVFDATYQFVACAKIEERRHNANKTV